MPVLPHVVAPPSLAAPLLPRAAVVFAVAFVAAAFLFRRALLPCSCFQVAPASCRRVISYPDTAQAEYTYDLIGEVEGVNDPSGVYRSSYDASFAFQMLLRDTLSRWTQMTRPNGINTNYSYDSLSRLLSMLHQSGTSTIDGASYTLDSARNRTAKTDNYVSVTSNHTYDAPFASRMLLRGAP